MGHKLTEEQKRKMSETKLRNKTHKYSAECRSKISKAHKGKVLVKDVDGKIFKVYRNNPLIISGELKIHNNGQIGVVTVRDKDGNTFAVKISDPRYVSGQLVPISKGYHHTPEAKEKISKAGKGKYLGSKFINNGIINKKIMANQLGEYLNNGWKLGTIVNYSGSKFINNGIMNKKIMADQLDEYLNTGWKLGFKSKIKKNIQT